MMGIKARQFAPFVEVSLEALVPPAQQEAMRHIEGSSKLEHNVFGWGLFFMPMISAVVPLGTRHFLSLSSRRGFLVPAGYRRVPDATPPAARF
jgi:hypothetical protein